jgi:hypothetical protein
MLSWDEEISYTNYFSEGWLFGCLISVGNFCSQRHSFISQQLSCLCPDAVLKLTIYAAWVHGVRSPDAYSGTEERQRYYTYPFETSELEWNGGQHPRLGGFTPVQTRYPFHCRRGEPQSWCGQALKIFLPLGFDNLTIQHIARRYSIRRCMVYSN